MRPIFLLLVLALLAVPLCGCRNTYTLRNPLMVDQECDSVAGPRLMKAPVYYAPQFAPQAAPQLPAGYAPAAGCR